MKQILILTTIALFFIFTSCDKTYQKMTVIKDCTGVYLRSEQGAEYFVCNNSTLSGYSDGDEIKVEIETVNECYGLLEPVTCSTVHPNQGKIEVVKIKS